MLTARLLKRIARLLSKTIGLSDNTAKLVEWQTMRQTAIYADRWSMISKTTLKWTEIQSKSNLIFQNQFQISHTHC